MFYPGWCLVFLAASVLSHVLAVPYPLAIVLLLVGWHFRDRIDPGRWLRWLQRGSSLDLALADAELRPFDAEARCRAGAELMERGRFAEAVPHLEAARERIRNDAEVHCLLGTALLRSGAAERAEPELRQAALLNPGFRLGEVQLRLAETLTRAGRPAEAHEVLASHFGTGSTNVEALVQMGLAARAAGREPEARAAFEQAKAAYRSNPRFRHRLDRVWVQQARRALGERLVADRLALGLILAAGSVFYLWRLLSR